MTSSSEVIREIAHIQRTHDWTRCPSMSLTFINLDSTSVRRIRWVTLPYLSCCIRASNITHARLQLMYPSMNQTLSRSLGEHSGTSEQRYSIFSALLFKNQNSSIPTLPLPTILDASWSMELMLGADCELCVLPVGSIPYASTIEGPIYW